MIVDYKKMLWQYIRDLAEYYDSPRVVMSLEPYRKILIEDMSYEHIKKIYDASNDDWKSYWWRPNIVRELGKMYIVTVVLMVDAFKLHRDNFDNFAAIIDDVTSINLDYKSENYQKIDPFLNNMYLEKLLSISSYKDLPNFRKFMINAITNLDTYEFDRIYKIYKGLCFYKNVYDSDYLDSIFDLRVKSIMENGKDKTFWSEIILAKEGRFSYINEKLIEVEDNELIREDVFSYIRDLNSEMFADLNQSSDKDSFITCMDVVFDSDTYSEMSNKLKELKNASFKYAYGKRKEAFEIIRDFGKCSYKEVLNGKEVSYPKNSINVITKPKKIIDRMRELYPKFDSSISSDFLDNVHRTSSKLNKFNKIVQKERNKSVKQKIKLFGK